MVVRVVVHRWVVSVGGLVVPKRFSYGIMRVILRKVTVKTTFGLNGKNVPSRISALGTGECWIVIAPHPNRRAVSLSRIGQRLELPGHWTVNNRSLKTREKQTESLWPKKSKIPCDQQYKAALLGSCLHRPRVDKDSGKIPELPCVVPFSNGRNTSRYKTLSGFCITRRKGGMQKMLEPHALTELLLKHSMESLRWWQRMPRRSEAGRKFVSMKDVQMVFATTVRRTDVWSARWRGTCVEAV